MITKCNTLGSLMSITTHSITKSKPKWTLLLIKALWAASHTLKGCNNRPCLSYKLSITSLLFCIILQLKYLSKLSLTSTTLSTTLINCLYKLYKNFICIWWLIKWPKNYKKDCCFMSCNISHPESYVEHNCKNIY